MNITDSRNVNTGTMMASGNIILGNDNIIINLKEAAQYKELESRLSKARELFDKASANALKYPDIQEFKDEKGRLLAEQNEIEDRIDELKTAVFKLADDFARISINTDRLLLAKQYFEKGEYDSARAVLTAQTMQQDLHLLKEEQQHLIDRLAENTARLKDSSAEFLILARLTSIDFNNTNRVELARQYFEQSVYADASIDNLLEYLVFLNGHGQYAAAIALAPRLEPLMAGISNKSDETLVDAKITFLNAKGFLAAQQERFEEASVHYRQALDYCRNRGANEGNGSGILYLVILNNIASLFYKLADYDTALQFAKDSLKEYKAIGKTDARLAWEFARAQWVAALTCAKIFKVYKAGNRAKFKTDGSKCFAWSEEYFKKAIKTLKTISDDNPALYLADYVACLVDEAKIIREQKEITKADLDELNKTYRDALQSVEDSSKQNPGVLYPVLVKCQLLYAGFSRRCYNAMKPVLEEMENNQDFLNLLQQMADEMLNTSLRALDTATILFKEQGRPYLPLLALCQKNLGYVNVCLAHPQTALDYFVSALQSYNSLEKAVRTLYLEDIIAVEEPLGYLYLEQNNIAEAEAAFLRLDDAMSASFHNNPMEYIEQKISNFYMLGNIFRTKVLDKEKSLRYVNKSLECIAAYEEAAGESFTKGKQQLHEIIAFWNKKDGVFTRLKRMFS